MQTREGMRRDAAQDSYGSVLKEVGGRFKRLVESEVHLIQAEIKDTSATLARYTAQAAIFGALTGISVLPLLAFAVIGLGAWLNGRYWLSSLIVAVSCAFGGGWMAWRAFEQLKQQDVTLPRARRALAREGEIVGETIEDIGEAVRKGRAP